MLASNRSFNATCKNTLDLRNLAKNEEVLLGLKVEIYNADAFKGRV